MIDEGAPAIALRSVTRVRELACGVGAISPDGALVVGSRDGGLEARDLDDNVRWRADAAIDEVHFSSDGAAIVTVCRKPAAIDVWDAETGRRVAHRDLEDPPGPISCRDDTIAFDDIVLTLPELDVGGGPHRRDRQLRCTERFVVEHTSRDLWLYDEHDERYILRHDSRAESFAVATAGGRFALGFERVSLYVHDLAMNRMVRFAVPDDPIFAARVSASHDGRWLVISSTEVSLLFELDWQRDPDGDRDPLSTAWATEPRPPIVTELRVEIERASIVDGLVRYARNHPELELAIAVKLPASQGYADTRRLLDRPEVAAQPEAWHQLAKLAMHLGLVDEAADGIAEGLGRDEDNAALHELLASAQRARSGPRSRLLQPRQRWWPKLQRDGIATIDDTVVMLGVDDTHHEHLRVWDFDGALLRELRVASSITAPVSHVGSTLRATGRHVVVKSSRGIFALDLDSDHDGLLTPFAVELQENQSRSMLLVAVGSTGRVLTTTADERLRWHELVGTTAATIDTFGADISAYELAACGDDAILRDARRLLRLSRARVASAGNHQITRIASTDNLVVAGDHEGTIHRWTPEVESLTWLTPLAPLVGHRGEIAALACRDELVVSADRKGVIRWWRDDTCVAIGDHPHLSQLTIAVDGTVVSSSFDEIVVWPRV